MKLVIAPTFDTDSLYFNNRIYPFSDVKFRRAVAYIVDRDKVRELSNYYFTAIKYETGLVPSKINDWINTKDLNPYEVNHKKADELLIEMGLNKNSEGFWCDENGKEF